MSQGMSPEFVLGYRAMMLDGITREAKATKKVIAAVPDASSDYQSRSERPHREGIGVAHREHRHPVSGWHCRHEVQHGHPGAQTADIGGSGGMV